MFYFLRDFESSPQWLDDFDFHLQLLHHFFSVTPWPWLPTPRHHMSWSVWMFFKDIRLLSHINSSCAWIINCCSRVFLHPGVFTDGNSPSRFFFQNAHRTTLENVACSFFKEVMWMNWKTNWELFLSLQPDRLLCDCVPKHIKPERCLL